MQKRLRQGDVFRPLTFCTSMPSPGEVGHLSNDVLLVEEELKGCETPTVEAWEVWTGRQRPKARSHVA